MLRQDFQCRITQELCIARSIDDTHAALTKLRRDFIRANTCTWCDCHTARDYNECGRGLIVRKAGRISPTTPLSGPHWWREFRDQQKVVLSLDFSGDCK